MRNIFSIRFADPAKGTTDPCREKFTKSNDHQLDFLLQMVSMFKEMGNNIRGQHIRVLTGEMENAPHGTQVGIMELIRILLSRWYDYVLSGKLSSAI